MEVMDIRSARIEDAPQIAHVHVRSWQGAYRGLLPEAYLDSLDPVQRASTWTRRLAETDWSHGGTLVADGAVQRDDSFGFPMTEVRYRRPLLLPVRNQLRQT